MLAWMILPKTESGFYSSSGPKEKYLEEARHALISKNLRSGDFHVGLASGRKKVAIVFASNY